MVSLSPDVLNKRASICTPLVEVHVRSGKSAEKQLDPKSKKVKTGGGSFGYGMLIALLGLVGLRRFKK